MEYSRSLRSLEAPGGPLGTERSTPLAPSAGRRERTGDARGFQDELATARRASESPERMPARPRSSAGETPAREPDESSDALQDSQPLETPEAQLAELEPVAIEQPPAPVEPEVSQLPRAAKLEPRPAAVPSTPRAPVAQPMPQGIAVSAALPGETRTATTAATEPTGPTPANLALPEELGSAPFVDLEVPAPSESESWLASTEAEEAGGPPPAPRMQRERAMENGTAELPRREPPAEVLPRIATTPQVGAGEVDPPREVDPPARSEPPAAAPEPDRAAEILRQIRLQLRPELRQASIQLQPPELGRLVIRLEVRKSRLRAEMVAEREETLSALERHAPELRAALAAAGFGEAELSLRSAGEPETSRERAAGGRARAWTIDSAPPRELEAALSRRLGIEGCVDTYA